jgi:hypothetical protein
VLLVEYSLCWMSQINPTWLSHCVECQNAQSQNAECQNAECQNAECHNTECHNAECHGAISECKHLSITEIKLPQNSVKTLEWPKPNSQQYFSKCLEHLLLDKNGQLPCLRLSTFAVLSVSLFRFEKAYALYRVTRLDNCLPIGLFLEFHYDCLKRWGSPK